LFHTAKDDAGVDNLLGLLGEAVATSPGSKSAVDLSQSSLSVRGQLLADEVMEGVTDDAEMLAALERACPNWRENVSFAMMQQSRDDVSDALENVRKSREKLLRGKAEIMRAIEREHAALDLFEDALEKSLTRFTDSGDDESVQEGFFSQLPGSPGRRPTQRETLEDAVESTPLSPIDGARRESLDSEAPTIVPTLTAHPSLDPGEPSHSRHLSTVAEGRESLEDSMVQDEEAATASPVVLCGNVSETSNCADFAKRDPFIASQ
jgi:hypothetical protein